MGLRNTVVAQIVGDFKDGISKKAERAFRRFKSFSSDAFSVAKKGALALSAAGALTFAVAISNASAFNSQIQETSTLMDTINDKQLSELQTGVLRVSDDFVQLRDKATKALFDINSASFQGKDGLDVLKESSRLAVAGVSDTSKTADLLTSALNAFGKDASEAGKISDIFFATQKKGKTTISELAASLPNVFPSARLAGQGLEMLGAATATMTANGISTAETVTALNGLLLALAAPTDAAQKAMDRLGIRTKDAHGNMLPLIAIVRQFEGLPVDVIRKVIPDQSAIKAIASLSGNLKTFKQNLDFIRNATGATQAGFDKMADTFNFKINKMTGGLGNLLTRLGTFIVQNKMVKAVLDIVNKTIQDASGFLDKNKKEVGELINLFIELAVATGPKVVEFFREFMGDAGNLMNLLSTFSSQIIPTLVSGFNILRDTVNGLRGVFAGLKGIISGSLSGLSFLGTGLAGISDRLGITRGSRDRLAAFSEQQAASANRSFSRASSLTSNPSSSFIRNPLSVFSPASSSSRSSFNALPLGSTRRVVTTRSANGISLSGRGPTTVSVGGITVQGGNKSPLEIAREIESRLTRLIDRRR